MAFLFVKWVVPVYAYQGYTVNYNFTNIIISVCIIAIISYFITIQADKIKTFFISILLLQVVVPMLCLFSFTEEFMFYHIYIVMVTICVIVISFINYIYINLENSKYISLSFNKLFLPIMTFITFFTLSRYIMLNGLGIFNLDITKVYDYRFLLRETMTGIFAYLDGWTVKIINPFCIVYSLHKKKKFLTIFFVILQILLFGFSSHKSVLFSAFVLVVFYYIMPVLSSKKWSVVWLFICSCFFPLIMSFRGITDIWLALFRRLFFSPATLNFYYYDYFSTNSFDWFRQSFLRHFVSSNYDLLLPRIIGLEYFGNMETNANTGFLGAGYAQGGFLIMIVYSVIIGMLINVIAAFCKKLPPGLAVGITILPMSSLFTSGDLPSSLVTGGLLIALFLLYIMSRDPTISTID